MLLTRYYRLAFAVATVFILSSCHSKKLVVKSYTERHGSYVMVKPDKSLAEKYAAFMGISRNDIQNGRLYSFIDEWYGTPYKFGGMGKDGVDCSALVFLLQLQVYDQPLPRTCALQVNIIKRKYEEELQEGDLVFFDFDGKQFSHVGVYLQNGYFVHASTRKGVIIARLHDNGIYKYFSRGGAIVDPTTSAHSDVPNDEHFSQ